MLQFSMHASLIHVNITVGVPTLPTGIDADAMKGIQEGRALVGDFIISITIVINYFLLHERKLIKPSKYEHLLSKFRMFHFLKQTCLSLTQYHVYVMTK